MNKVKRIDENENELTNLKKKKSRIIRNNLHDDLELMIFNKRLHEREEMSELLTK
jgi:hypothetical protein